MCCICGGKKRIKVNSKVWACVVINMKSPFMKTRKCVIDSNRQRMHVVIYKVSTEGKARNV